MKNVLEVVAAVHERATAIGMDLAPSDVGFILSLFFEGLIDHSNPAPVDNWLQTMADEVSKIKDE